jgi:anaphase-promoting complex subunit 1
MKTLTKNMIMWDSIGNTTDFIRAQIPELILFIYEHDLKEISEKYQMIYNIEEIDFHTVNLIYVNIIGGCVMSMGMKYAGTCDD